MNRNYPVPPCLKYFRVLAHPVVKDLRRIEPNLGLFIEQKYNLNWLGVTTLVNQISILNEISQLFYLKTDSFKIAQKDFVMLLLLHDKICH